ncbi:GDYXXLXY domain-containing protein [Phenylobacterium sp.]|uniref:GDYXXLXY domain-containing protein n=1 Tax=Phenylobacterium sp. TaxID=1871053 RepID=UPI00301D5DE9
MRFPAPRARILAAAVVLTVTLCGLVVREGVARAGGQEIRLAITGYDPRSLLSGHYVRFQIRGDDPGGLACPPGSERNAGAPRRWVALRRQGEAHVASGAAGTRTEAAALGEVVVRGSLTCMRVMDETVLPDGAVRRESVSRLAAIDLGVDRIHLDQAQAQTLERRLQGREEAAARAFAVFSVDAGGKARLKGLVVDGRRYDLNWW